MTVVERITVTRPEGAGGVGVVMLGRADLGQTDTIGTAEASHLAVLFDGDRPLSVMNAAQSRRLSMTYADGRSFGDRDIYLARGDAFLLGEARFRVEEATPDRIVIAGPDGRRHALPQVFDPSDSTGFWAGWESGTMLFGGLADHDPSRLPPPGLLEGYLSAAHPYWSIRVAVPGAAEATLRLSREGSEWRLRVLQRAFVQICRAGTDCRDPSRQTWPLVSDAHGRMTEIVVGRTTYEVAFDATSLTLLPTTRAHWLTEDRAIPATALTPGVVQQSSPPFQRGIGALGSGPQGFAAAVLAAVQPFLSWTGVLVLAIGLCAMAASARPRHPAGMVRILLLALFCLAAQPTLEVKVPELPAALLSSVVSALPALPWLEAPFSDPRRAFFALTGIFAGFGLLMRAFLPAFWHPVAVGGRLRHAFPRRIAARIAIIGLCLAGFWLLRDTSAGAVAAPSTAVLRDGLQPQSMVTALILLYLMVGALLAVTAWASIAPFLWLVLTCVVGFGTLNADVMVFGHRLPMYRELFDMHVMAMAAMALVCGTLAVADRHAMAEFLRRRVRRLQSAPSSGLRRLRVPAPRLRLGFTWLADLWSVAGWIGARLGRLVILAASVLLAYLLFTTSEAGVAGFVQPSEVGKTWIAILVALTLAALHEREIWRMPYEARLRRRWPALFLAVVFLSFAAGSAINSDLSPILILTAMMAVSLVVLLLVNIAQRFAFGWFLAGAFVVVVLLTLIAVIHEDTAAFLLAATLLLWLLVDRPREATVLTGTETYRSAWSRRMRGRLSAGEWLRDRLDRARQLVKVAQLSFGGLVVAGAALLLVLPDLRNLTSAFTDPARLEIYDSPLPATVQDRFLSWVDGSIFRVEEEPAPLVRHPDLLLQVRESREVVAASGCRFASLIQDFAQGLPPRLPATVPDAIDRSADRMTGLPGLCRTDGVLPVSGEMPRYVLAVPAIQDDFAGTFFVAVFGTDGMLALMMAQAGLVLTIWVVAGAAISFGMHHRPMRSVSMLGAVFLFNAGFILLAQFAMAWSNMLGLLPVVGQPMTFLSFAGSHHLFVALPAVATALAFALIHSSPRALAPRPLFLGHDLHRHLPAA